MDVSDEIKRRIAAGGLGLDTLPGIDSEVIERELMIEKLTGHVLPSSGHPKVPPLPRLAVDHARADITLDGASRSAIADALNHTIAIALRRLEARPEEAEGPAADPTTSRAGIGLTRRVRSILTTPRELRGATGRRWLAVEVLPTLNQDTGRLIVTVTDRRFPLDRRDLASQLLTQLAADYPVDGFVAELRNAAAPALKDPPPLRDTIARLERSAAGTAGIPAGQRRARHREMFELAQQAEGQRRGDGRPGHRRPAPAPHRGAHRSRAAAARPGQPAGQRHRHHPARGPAAPEDTRRGPRDPALGPKLRRDPRQRARGEHPVRLVP
jgi:hypothetical protein